MLAVAVGGAFWLWGTWTPYTADKQQQYNLQRAEECLPGVRVILDTHSRFKDVQVGVYTGQNGAVGLCGFVETPDDLFQLMRAVAAERLPVATHWQVKVLADEPGQK